MAEFNIKFSELKGRMIKVSTNTTKYMLMWIIRTKQSLYRHVYIKIKINK